MSAPDLAFYDSGDAAPIGTLSLSATPGTPGAATVLHLWNQKGGTTAETSRGGRLIVEARDPGETYWTGSGRQPVDERWFECRRTGATGTADPALDAWTPLGAGAWLRLQDLPVNSAIYLEVRLNIPMTFPSTAPVTVEFHLTVDDRDMLAMGGGHSEDGQDGVFSGLGDGAFSALIRGGAVVPSSTPDSNVQVPYFAWIAAGLPYAAAASSTAISGSDGAAVALASGEEYIALLAASASGIVVTKGLKASAGSAARPAVPAGQLPIAYVLRDFAGAIDSAHITGVAVFWRFPVTSSGLLATLGPGSARRDNFLVDLAYPRALPALTDGATNYVWLAGDGPVVTTTADRPEPRALLLWELDTASGSVSAVRDRRRLIGLPPRRRLLFSGALAAGNDSSQEVVEGPLPLLLDPDRPATLALADLGSGNTSGQHRVDVQVLADDGTPTSIYPDTGSMPQIAYNGTVPVTAISFPTTLVVAPGKRLRAHVSAIPAGGTAASGALLILGG